MYVLSYNDRLSKLQKQRQGDNIRKINMSSEAIIPHFYIITLTSVTLYIKKIVLTKKCVLQKYSFILQIQ